MNINSLQTHGIYNDIMATKGENKKKGMFAGTLVGAIGTGYATAKVYEPLLKKHFKPSVINEFRCSKADIKAARLKTSGKMAVFCLLTVAGTYAAMKLGGAIGSLFDK